MNPLLAGIAAIAVAGAVLAASAREPRATVLGLLIVLLAVPLVVDPWPGPFAILARIAAALLAARLLSIGLRGDFAGEGSRIGWQAEALAALAAAVAGYASHGLGAAALGPAEAQAAGFALGALAAAPLVTGRDVLRLSVGSILLLEAAILVRQALDRPPTDAEHLVVALLTVGVGGAVAVTTAAARAGGGLVIADDGSGGAGPRLSRAEGNPPPEPRRRLPLGRPRRPSRTGR